MFFYDPTFILLIPALLFALYAQSKVNGTFQRYLRVYASSGMTGAEVVPAFLTATACMMWLLSGYMGT